MYTCIAGSVNYIRFDPMNGYLYSASDDCSLRVWDIQGVDMTKGLVNGETPPVEAGLVWRDEVDHVSILVENEQMAKPVELKCVAIHPFGGMVALGCSDNIARIWTTVTNMRRGAIKKASFTGHTMPVTDVCWSNKGDRLASASVNDGTVRVWSWADDNFRRVDHTVIRVGGSAASSSSSSRSKFARPTTASIQVDAVVWTSDDKFLITSEIRQTSKNAPTTDQAIKVCLNSKNSTLMFYFIFFNLNICFLISLTCFFVSLFFVTST